MGGLIPESATFLLARGRTAEAHRVMAKFGTISARKIQDEEGMRFPRRWRTRTTARRDRAPKLWTPELIGKTAALTIAALSWGLINFGLLLWMPNDLVAKGYSMGVSSKLLAESALIAFPTVFLCTFLYSRWSTKWALACMIVVTLRGLGVGAPARDAPRRESGLPDRAAHHRQQRHHRDSAALRGGMLPDENPRARHGLVAACTKGGGVLAQILSITRSCRPRVAAAGIIAPVMIALLFLRYGRETRGLDLRHLDRRAPAFPPILSDLPAA